MDSSSISNSNEGIYLEYCPGHLLAHRRPGGRWSSQTSEPKNPGLRFATGVDHEESCTSPGHLDSLEDLDLFTDLTTIRMVLMGWAAAETLKHQVIQTPVSVRHGDEE